MICFIYRSNKRAEMYLYTLLRDDFSNLPEPLLQIFGIPEFSMTLNLAKRSRLARVDIEKVKNELLEHGFYLQMPPVILEDQNSLNPKEESTHGK